MCCATATELCLWLPTMSCAQASGASLSQKNGEGATSNVQMLLSSLRLSPMATSPTRYAQQSYIMGPLSWQLSEGQPDALQAYLTIHNMVSTPVVMSCVKAVPRRQST